MIPVGENIPAGRDMRNENGCSYCEQLFFLLRTVISMIIKRVYGNGHTVIIQKWIIFVKPGMCKCKNYKCKTECQRKLEKLHKCIAKYAKICKI